MAGIEPKTPMELAYLAGAEDMRLKCIQAAQAWVDDVFRLSCADLTYDWMDGFFNGATAAVNEIKDIEI